MPKRVNIVVEGQTEQGFVTEVLQRAYDPTKLHLAPRLLGVPGHKGGSVSLARLAKDVLLLLKSDPSACVTTFFDCYGLAGDWPGREGLPAGATTDRKKAAVEADLSAAVAERLGAVDPRRFRPYAQMHEFEGLLFSDPSRLASALQLPAAGAAALVTARAGVPTPEDLNDGTATAPSKRIIACHPAYERQKTIAGPIAALEVGVGRMRAECPRFADWLRWIES